MPAFYVPENLAFDNYDALIAALNDWLDRDDLTNAAPTMIARAEDDMILGLEPSFLDKSATVTCSGGVGALPTDYGTGVAVIYNGRHIPQVSPEMGREYVAGSTPVAFTIESAVIRLWPETDASVTLLYRPRLVRLSDANASNELLSRFPSLYFDGAIAKAGEYIRDPEVISFATASFRDMLKRASRYFTNQRYAGPLVPRVAWLP